jgi:hypothetical protein
LLRDGERILALSNNHVFAACNHTPVDMPILSPSTADARPGRRAPGELCRYDGWLSFAALIRTVCLLRDWTPQLLRSLILDL